MVARPAPTASADAVPAIDALDEPERSEVLAHLDVRDVEGFADGSYGRACAAELLP